MKCLTNKSKLWRKQSCISVPLVFVLVMLYFDQKRSTVKTQLSDVNKR